jgi:hypothetical protein
MIYAEPALMHWERRKGEEERGEERQVGNRGEEQSQNKWNR